MNVGSSTPKVCLVDIKPEKHVGKTNFEIQSTAKKPFLAYQIAVRFITEGLSMDATRKECKPLRGRRQQLAHSGSHHGRLSAEHNNA
jgi:hypothetical protein